jgi:hypothetical protein
MKSERVDLALAATISACPGIGLLEFSIHLEIQQRQYNKKNLPHTIQYNTMLRNTIRYNKKPLPYNTIQSLSHTIQCNTIQYNTIQYNAIQCNTIQCNTMQYNTIQYNTTQSLPFPLSYWNLDVDTVSHLPVSTWMSCTASPRFH